VTDPLEELLAAGEPDAVVDWILEASELSEAPVFVEGLRSWAMGLPADQRSTLEAACAVVMATAAFNGNDPEQALLHLAGIQSTTPHMLALKCRWRAIVRAMCGSAAGALRELYVLKQKGMFEERLDAILNCASRAETSGMLGVARQLLSSSTEEETPDDPSTFALRLEAGLLEWRVENVARAKEMLLELMLDPACPERLANQARVNLVGIAIDGDDPVPGEDRLFLCSSAAEWVLTPLLTQVNRAYLLYRDQDFTGMLHLAERILATPRAPDDPAVLVFQLQILRAAALGELGRFDEAFAVIDPLGQGQPSEPARARIAHLLGLLHVNRGDSSEALEQLEVAGVLYCQLGLAAKLERVLGDHLDVLGRFPIASSVELLERYARQGLDGDTVARLALDQADCDHGLGRWEAGRLLAEFALAQPHLGEATGDRASFLAALLTSGTRPDEAKERLIELVTRPSIATALGVRARMQLIGMRLASGEQLAEADIEFLLSDIALDQTDVSDLTRIFRALYWWLYGSAEKALRCLSSFDDAHGERWNPGLSLTILLTRSGVLASLGRYREAGHGLARAIVLAADFPALVRAEVYCRLGWIWLVQEEYEPAFECFVTSYALQREAVPEFPRYQTSLPVLLTCSILAGKAWSDTEFPNAGAAVDHLLAELPGDERPEWRAKILQTAGLVREDVAMIEEAARLYEGERVWMAAMDSWDASARHAQHRLEPERALTSSRRAFGLIQQLLAATNDDEARVGILARSARVGAFLVGLLAPMDLDEALRVALRTKSDALLRLMQTLARRRGPAMQISLRASPVLPAPADLSECLPPTPLRGASWGQPAIDLRATLALYEELTSSDVRAQQLGDELEISTARVLESIPDGVVAVEYLLGEDEVFAFILERGQIKLERTPWTAEDTDALDALDSAVRRAGSIRSASAQGHALLHGLSRLHEALLEPVLRRAEGRRMILATGARLAQVPFLALVDKAQSPFLLRVDGLSQVLSLSQLPFLQSIPLPGIERVFALRGDDAGARQGRLVHADDEIREVSAAWSAVGAEVVFASATWDNQQVLAAFEQASVVHYAGHARFDGRMGMAAALYPPGGPLTAADLLACNLDHVRLCVLSACESGRGMAAGEELSGFLRALFAAGVRGAYCSRWVVDDEATAWLMKRVYDLWMGGLAFDRAACLAAREMFNGVGRTEWCHPFFWANFAVYGKC